MRSKRYWQNTWLKSIAIKEGLEVGSEIIIHNRSLLKDNRYYSISRQNAIVLELYDYYFLCKLDDGSKESFRYNEFLGDESVLIVLKKNKKRR